MIIRGRQDIIFDTINYFLLALVFLAVAYPIWFVIIASLSNPDLVNSGRVWLIPRGVTLFAYENVFMDQRIWVGYANSLFYMTVGTMFNLVFILCGAYGLSRKGLVGRGPIMGVFVFTMYFHGGLVPTFLLIKKLGLLDTRWALVIPGAVGVWYVIIARTFFASTIPEELYESAKIDGASDAYIFRRIVLPLSKPVIAVIALYCAVEHWNKFFEALIYLPNKRGLHPLQMLLREILILNQQMEIDMSTLTSEEIEYYARMRKMAEAMKYALIMIASLPLLIIYPFVQRYFVKGVMVGSLKG